MSLNPRPALSALSPSSHQALLRAYWELGKHVFPNKTLRVSFASQFAKIEQLLVNKANLSVGDTSARRTLDRQLASACAALGEAAHKALGERAGPADLCERVSSLLRLGPAVDSGTPPSSRANKGDAVGNASVPLSQGLTVKQLLSVSLIAVTSALVPPIGLALIWTRPKWQWSSKLGLSVIPLISLLAICASVAAFSRIPSDRIIIDNTSETSNSNRRKSRPDAETAGLKHNVRSLTIDMSQADVLRLLGRDPDLEYKFAEPDTYRLCWDTGLLGIIVQLDKHHDGVLKRVALISDADAGYYVARPQEHQNPGQ